MTRPADDTPVRVEIRFHGGSGHRERFATLAEATQWLATPAFTTLAHRVRSVTIVAPHVRYPADPDRATPRPPIPVTESPTYDLPRRPRGEPLLPRPRPQAARP